MLKSDELKQAVAAKREEVIKLQSAGQIGNAVKAAEELDSLCDKLQIEIAKEKSRMENFMSEMTSGNCYSINPNDDSEDYQPQGRKAANSGKKYKAAFFNAVRDKFRNSADPILKVGTDVNGGYLVPAEMHNEIIQKLEETNIMREICTVIQTDSSHKIPIVASNPAASWVNEGQKIDFSDESFSQISLDAFKMATAIKVSNELLNDAAYNLEEFFVSQFVQAIGNAEEDSFINGRADSDVTNTPTGFLTTLAAETDAIVTTSTTSLDSDDLINIVYTLGRAYRKNACFLMNDSTMQKIRRMKDNTLNYIWTPSLTESEPDKLLGYAVYTSQFFPAASTGGDVALAFGDFSRYIIADRGGIIFKPLRELYALEDSTAFLMLQRVDGKLIDKHAIKLLRLKS